MLIPEKTYADPHNNFIRVREIEHQHSSPIASYDFKEDLDFHTVAITIPNEKLCQSTKQELRDLRFQLNQQKAMILDLKARAQAEADIILDWETKSRLAQGVIHASSVCPTFMPTYLTSQP